MIGIDLGTTNSVVAVSQKGKEEVLRFEGKSIFPSMFGYDSEGSYVIGPKAKDKGVSILKEKKVYMGTDEKFSLEHPITKEKTEYTSVDFSYEILKFLKNVYVSNGYPEDSEVCISVPAAFTVAQKRDTVKAAERAGINVKILASEPSAASTLVSTKTDAELLLVFDLGGGTFDCSLVLKIHLPKTYKPFSGLKGSENLSTLGDLVEDTLVEDIEDLYTYDIITSYGDTALGGRDIDKMIEDFLVEDFDLKLESLSEEERVILANFIEAGKHSELPTTIQGSGNLPTMGIDRTYLLGAYDTIMERIVGYVDKIHDEIDFNIDVVLVGGQTKSNILEESLRKYFPKFSLGQPIDPDKAVALGAARYGRLTSIEGLITERVNKPISLLVKGGILKPIFFEGLALPSKTNLRISPVNEGVVSISLYQGFSTQADNCDRIGKITFRDERLIKDKKFLITFLIQSDGQVTSEIRTLSGERIVEGHYSIHAIDKRAKKNLKENVLVKKLMNLVNLLDSDEDKEFYRKKIMKEMKSLGEDSTSDIARKKFKLLANQIKKQFKVS